MLEEDAGEYSLLAHELVELQESLAKIDRSLAYDMLRADGKMFYLLLCTLKNLKIRMDGNQNHRRPHIHIDYGKDYHSASYAIDTGELWPVSYQMNTIIKFTNGLLTANQS